MDYNKCRLCLEETNRYVEIFNETFPEMIELLTGIKVNSEDGLPTMACLQCHQEVKSAMLTRYQIINSHKILLDELKCNVAPCIELNTYLNSENDSVDNEYLYSDNKDLPQNKLMGIKKDETEEDCNSLEYFNCYDNDGSDLIVSNHTINSQSTEKDVKTEIRASEKQKETETAKESKKRKAKNSFNKDIKFRKKTTNRQKRRAGDKIEFKKKTTNAENMLSVKVQYNIKPEHKEFLKTVGRKDRVACPECGRVMFGMNMKNHLITHNYDPVVCDICGKTSKNAQALQDHINYYHKTTPDRFMCDKCGKGYRVRFMLERHEKKEHGNGEKDYECSICGKKFFEKLHLKNHINITHNKVKAYKCEHCGKDFGRRTQFVTHQLVHTKENRYHCQVCGKGFKIKQTMQTHLKGVHGIEEEKTIFCKICQKGFSTPQGLRAHINSRVHGLEKCEHCSEFITVEFKSVHLRDIHGIKTETAYS